MLIVPFCLVYDRCQYPDCIVSNDRMINEGRIGKDLEGGFHELTEVIFRNFPGGTEVDHETAIWITGVPVQIRT
jgi:hypothetical protein